MNHKTMLSISGTIQGKDQIFSQPPDGGKSAAFKLCKIEDV
jgi:hypothetical protein